MLRSLLRLLAHHIRLGGHRPGTTHPQHREQVGLDRELSMGELFIRKNPGPLQQYIRPNAHGPSYGGVARLFGASGRVRFPLVFGGLRAAKAF